MFLKNGFNFYVYQILSKKENRMYGIYDQKGVQWSWQVHKKYWFLLWDVLHRNGTQQYFGVLNKYFREKNLHTRKHTNI